MPTVTRWKNPVNRRGDSFKNPFNALIKTMQIKGDTAKLFFVPQGLLPSPPSKLRDFSNVCKLVSYPATE